VCPTAVPAPMPEAQDAWNVGTKIIFQRRLKIRTCCSRTSRSLRVRAPDAPAAALSRTTTFGGETQHYRLPTKHADDREREAGPHLRKASALSCAISTTIQRPCQQQYGNGKYDLHPGDISNREQRDAMGFVEGKCMQ